MFKDEFLVFGHFLLLKFFDNSTLQSLYIRGFVLYGDIYQLSIHKTLYACIIAFYDACITYAALILMLRRLVDVPKWAGWVMG